MQAIKKLSDIKIAENRKKTLQFLNNNLKHRNPDFPAPAFFMLLGAGCSAGAKIPTGGGIIKYMTVGFYTYLYQGSETQAISSLSKTLS